MDRLIVGGLLPFRQLRPETAMAKTCQLLKLVQIFNYIFSNESIHCIYNYRNPYISQIYSNMR